MSHVRKLIAVVVLTMTTVGISTHAALAQASETATASAAIEEDQAPLTAEELEVLVARIALYPDELVALVIAASIYPLQVVQAARFLEGKAKDSALVPNDKWDGSIISLLNYPDIVKMMNGDLEWTEQLGEAAVNQQQELLIAIQQLRDKAIANGILESTEDVVVETVNDNVVIESATPELVYVPTYPPEMLYEPGYPYQPIYYSDPYPSYYYPGAPFWAGLFTGLAFGAIIDWDDWDVWGGDIDVDFDIDNIDIDRIGDIDWKNFDRDKINTGDIKFDKNDLKNKVDRSDRNNIANKVKDRPRQTAANKIKGQDVRKSMEKGLKKRDPGARPAPRDLSQGQGARAKASPTRKPASGQKAKTTSRKPTPKQVSSKRTSKPKAAARVDRRPKKPSMMGNVDRGKKVKVYSKRGRSGGGGGGGRRGGGGGRR
jgi:uncharacterized membrane protein YgcG